MNGPGYCELCGRTGPVTADDVARTPDYWTPMTLQGYPNICGTSCYMLPALSLVKEWDRDRKGG